MRIGDKSAEKILKYMENRPGDTSETLTAAMQIKIVNKLCDTLDVQGASCNTE